MEFLSVRVRMLFLVFFLCYKKRYQRHVLFKTAAKRSGFATRFQVKQRGPLEQGL